MKRGFTLLEVLVAVAIIAVLAGLLFVVGRSTGQASQIEQTRMAVQQSRSITEVFRAQPSTLSPLGWVVGGVYGVHAPTDGVAKPFWQVWRVDVSGQSWPMQIRSEAISTDPAEWVNSELAVNSILAWESIEKQYATYGDVMQNTVAASVVVGGQTHTVHVPVDAWRRPLLICPGAGMTTNASPVYKDEIRHFNGETAEYLVISVKAQELPQVVARTRWGAHKPSFGFFSAGPDGDPSTFADNIWQ